MPDVVAGADVDGCGAGVAGEVRLAREDFALDGASGDQTELSRLPTPAEYQLDPSPSLDASVEDLAVLYKAYAGDTENGISEATTFSDAVAMQRTIDQIEQTSSRFFG